MGGSVVKPLTKAIFADDRVGSGPSECSDGRMDVVWLAHGSEKSSGANAANTNLCMKPSQLSAII
jgi:hypothetical protein